MNDEYGALVPEDQSAFTPPQIPNMDYPASTTRYLTDQLYSAHLWPAGAVVAQEYPVFITPVRQAGQGFALPLSYLHTNLISAGQIPAGASWQINKIGVYAAAGNDPDDNINFFRHCVVIMNKGADDYARPIGPAATLPGGAGMTGVATTTNPVTDLRETANGIASAAAMWELDTPLILTQQESFSFSFQLVDYIGAGLTNFNQEVIMYLRLIGSSRRNVQQ
jgi:hypothetical protein